MTSKKQIAANKKNAKKGGVKTQKGKEISKMNAQQHGILSRHLYVTTGDDITSYEEFAAFRESLFTELCPVGAVETFLVERLFAVFWRLKRLHIAETGFIEKQQDTHLMKHMFDKMDLYGTARRDAENTFYQRIRTAHGCRHVANCWGAILEQIKEKGLPISKNAEYNTERELGGASGYYRVEAFCIFNRAVRNKDTEPLSEEEEKRFNE